MHGDGPGGADRSGEERERLEDAMTVARIHQIEGTRRQGE